MKLWLLPLLALSLNVYSSTIKEIITQNPICYGGIKATSSRLAIKAAHNGISLFDLSTGQHHMNIVADEFITDFTLTNGKVLVLLKNQLRIHPQNESEEVQIINLDPELGWANEVLVVDDKILISRDKSMLEVFDAQTFSKINQITLRGEIHSVAADADRLYVLADTTGETNGSIYNSIFVLKRDSLKFERETRVFTNPTGHIEIIGDNILIGRRLFWQLDKKAVLSKYWIDSWKGLLLPTPSAMGTPFRDSENLYYCNEESNTLVTVNRKSFEK